MKEERKTRKDRKTDRMKYRKKDIHKKEVKKKEGAFTAQDFFCFQVPQIILT
jgi:hypothetical protein